MEKIKFVTGIGTVEIDNVNVSSLTGEKILRLSSFDGNSARTKVQAVQCIGMAGQRALSVLPDVKTVTADIAFAPVFLRNNRRICTGSAGMFTLRREILKRFPLGLTGTLTYTNDVSEYEIQARVDEYPTITVKDGYLCECRIMFTCDYPYWCRTLQSEIKTVSSINRGAEFETLNLGDVASPISGTIKCTSALGSLSEGVTDYFILTEGGDTNRAIHFVKPLSVNEQLYFSLEYGNEFIVKKRTLYSGGSSSLWEDAYEYIDFPTKYEPCHIRSVADGVGGTLFIFRINTSGSAEVQLNYHHLYTAV